MATPDINKAYQWAINTCNAPNVGYSQDYRNQQTVRGITYYDCSSFIWFALKSAGFPIPDGGNAFTTSDMLTTNSRTNLKKLGFEQVDINGEWKAGDVVWRNGHTEMVHTGGVAQGVTMGAHTSKYELARQVSINTYTSTASQYTQLWRYGEGASGGYGYSIYVISALCGNAWRESNINPSLNQVGGSAFGIFQWDGTRKTNLLNWLSGNGYESNSPDGQMEYLIVEDDWIQKYGSYSNLTEFLESTSTDIEELTKCFCKCWERAGVEAMEERVAHAYECYDYILAHAQDTTITTWVSEDRYLTTAEILNNAVLLYRYYSIGGGGGKPSKEKHRMPLYMMIKFYK